MKTKQHIIIAVALLTLSTLNSQLSTVLAQGSLTPPGPPAPTMKTLSQIEPRTPISSAPYAITNPGSYYLTTNIVGVSGKDGIDIMTNHVTVDLNGFALLGAGVGVYGIYVPFGVNDVTVRNGMISGWNDAGVFSFSANTVEEHLNILGCTGSAIYNGDGPSVVRDCFCQSNGVPSNLAVITCEGGVVSGCVVLNNVSEQGIDVAGNGGSVSGCLVANNAGVGIEIDAGSGWQILGNTCVSNGGVGIEIGGNDDRIEGNHVVTSSGIVGIQVPGSFATNNVVIKNTVSGNGANNYSNPGNNDFGPIGTAATSTSPWANLQ